MATDRRLAVLAVVALGWALPGAVGALPGVSGSLDQPPDTPASDKPAYLEDAGIEQQIGAQLPLDLAFTDEQGRAVHLRDYFGDKPVILAPVYYRCPMLCTLTLEGLARSLKVLTFGADTEYTLVAYSFNPEETPEEALKRKTRSLQVYGREGAAEGWHFLTGDENAIRRLNEAIGFRAVLDEQTGEFVHAATILLATPTGQVARYFYGVEYPPKDLRLGLVEASQEKLGNAIDQVLLYCYRYDPSTGKYTLLTMRLLRIGAAVTVAVLATMILIFLRLEKRRAEHPSEGLA